MVVLKTGISNWSLFLNPKVSLKNNFYFHIACKIIRFSKIDRLLFDKINLKIKLIVLNENSSPALSVNQLPYEQNHWYNTNGLTFHKNFPRNLLKNNVNSASQSFLDLYYKTEGFALVKKYIFLNKDIKNSKFDI